MTLTLLDGPSLQPLSGKDPEMLVVLLHGYGSNGADMIALAPMWRSTLPDALFLAPNAPEYCAHSPGGFQWWALTNYSRPALAAGARRAAPALNAFLDAQLKRYGLSEDKLLLVGFSQGTMMALHVGPCREKQVAGIVGYSGMLADPRSLEGAVRTKPPVLLVHGTADQIVPVAAIHEAKRELHRHGFEVETHVASGLAHGVDPHGMELGRRFARKVLGVEVPADRAAR
jgi:phospholipase/carboxylesterase